MDTKWSTPIVFALDVLTSIRTPPAPFPSSLPFSLLHFSLLLNFTVELFPNVLSCSFTWKVTPRLSYRCRARPTFAFAIAYSLAVTIRIVLPLHSPSLTLLLLLFVLYYLHYYNSPHYHSSRDQSPHSHLPRYSSPFVTTYCIHNTAGTYTLLTTTDDYLLDRTPTVSPIHVSPSLTFLTHWSSPTVDCTTVRIIASFADRVSSTSRNIKLCIERLFKQL